MEQTVISLLVKEKPREVVDAAATVVSEEARELCKRNSNSILMKKDQESLMSFTWDKFNKELEIRAPNVLRIVSSIVSDIPPEIGEKKYMNILHTVASGLHGRSMEMSGLHYTIAFVLVHGGCTLRDIDRLAKIGLCVTSSSVHKKLCSWKDSLDEAIIKLRTDWENGGRDRKSVV